MLTETLPDKAHAPQAPRRLPGDLAIWFFILAELLAFAVFVLLLAGHSRFGWRGRTANGLAIAGSIFLTLAYFGSRFVREVLL